MRQRENESGALHMKRFKVNLDTLISAGEKYILCSPELMEVVNPDKATDDKTEVEENKFKALAFLKRSDNKIHGDFLQELQNGTHMNRDECLASETDALVLMMRRSGVLVVIRFNKVGTITEMNLSALEGVEDTKFSRTAEESTLISSLQQSQC